MYLDFTQSKIVEFLAKKYPGLDVDVRCEGSAHGLWFWNGELGRHEQFSIVQLREMFGLEGLFEVYPQEINVRYNDIFWV